MSHYLFCLVHIFCTEEKTQGEERNKESQEEYKHIKLTISSTFASQLKKRDISFYLPNNHNKYQEILYFPEYSNTRDFLQQKKKKKDDKI